MATTVRLATHCGVGTGSARHCLDTLRLEGLVKQVGMESEASGRQRSMLWALGDDEVSPPLERQVRFAKEWQAGGVQRDPLVAALFGPAGATQEARV
ncbi:MAG: hypothetical protein K2X55_28065 [Burkholderiaceae bacterium]|nr:hypothetical protein [Burkholderiaceae bacterium]